MDHYVAVDTMEAVMLDSTEEYSFHLAEEALRMCGGVDARKHEVAEARQIVNSSGREGSARGSKIV